MSRGWIGPVALLAGVGALALVGERVWNRKAPPAAAQGRPPSVIPCTLARVERADLVPQARLMGTVRSLRRARLGFDVAGLIAEIAVREGDEVDEGLPLARLVDADREVRLALARAGVALEQRQLDLLLAGTRPEELGRFQAQLRAAEADVEWTTGEAERLRAMQAEKLVSSSSYESMVSQRNAAVARREAAVAALRLAEAGTRAEEIAVQRARVAQREAEVAVAQREKDRTALRAPFAGQVVRRLLAPGDAVNPGQAVLELIDLRHREVDLEVPARHAARMADRPRAVLSVDEHLGWSLTTELSAQVRAADERSGALRALIHLAPGTDDARVLAPGTFVRATVELAALRQALLVPSDALRRTLEGHLLVKAQAPPPPPAGAGPGAGPSGPGAGPGGPPGGGPPPKIWVATLVPVRVLGEHEGRTAVALLGPPLEAGDPIVLVGADRAVEGALLLERPSAGGPAAPPPAGGRP